MRTLMYRLVKWGIKMLEDMGLREDLIEIYL